MRRAVTTEYLKDCLGTALVSLMQEKPVEKISVNELVKRAHVGRTTYFRYFSSKDELLSYQIERLWGRYLESVEEDRTMRGKSCDFTRTQLLQLVFEFYLSIHETVDIVLGTSHERSLMISPLGRAFASGPSAEGYYQGCFIGYGVCGVICAWARRGYQESPKHMVEIVSSLWNPDDER